MDAIGESMDTIDESIHTIAKSIHTIGKSIHTIDETMDTIGKSMDAIGKSSQGGPWPPTIPRWAKAHPTNSQRPITRKPPQKQNQDPISYSLHSPLRWATPNGRPFPRVRHGSRTPRRIARTEACPPRPPPPPAIQRRNPLRLQPQANQSSPLIDPFQEREGSVSDLLEFPSILVS
jgi:hypothetical protein